MLSKSDVLTLLRAIGMRVFVQHYARFSDFRLSNQQVADFLPTKYTLHSRRSRTSTARRIIRAGKSIDALGMILEAERVDRKTAATARTLITQLRTNPPESAQRSRIVNGKIATFHEVLAAIEEMPADDQEALVEVLARRRVARKRAEHAENIRQARREFESGRLRPQSVAEIMADILS